MGFFTNVKNAGITTKLKGNIVLLDREMVARKMLLGVELYNLLIASERKSSNNGVSMPNMFHALRDSIKVPFDACRADTGVLEDRKEGMEQELVHMAANRDRARMPRTNGEKLQQTGKWFSDSGVEAKMQVQMKLINREIHQRKEQFGLQVYEIVIASSSSGSSTDATTAAAAAPKGGIRGIKAGISNRLSKMSSDEKEIQECIDKAKKDMNLIQNKKERKVREIEQLDEVSAAWS